MTCKMKHVSSELDTDQGEGIKQKLKLQLSSSMIEYNCILQVYQMNLMNYPLPLSMIKH